MDFLGTPVVSSGIWGNFGVILGRFWGNLGLFRDLFRTLIRRESFGVKSPKFGQILWRKWTFLGALRRPQRFGVNSVEFGKKKKAILGGS